MDSFPLNTPPSNTPATPMQDRPVAFAPTRPDQTSLYTSPIVQVYVGQTSKLFNVHKDILTRSPVFRSQIHDHSDGSSVMAPEISTLVFDLMLRSLYGQPFDEWKYKLTLPDEPNIPDLNTLKPACELLCVALEHELVDLKIALTSYFQRVCDVPYRLILAAAKFIYTSTLSVEPWFEELICTKTREALIADPDLVDATWFIEVFEHGNGGLSKCLFQCYKSFCRSTHTSVFAPTLETNGSVNSSEQGRCKQLASPDTHEDPGRVYELVRKKQDQISQRRKSLSSSSTQLTPCDADSDDSWGFSKRKKPKKTKKQPEEEEGGRKRKEAEEEAAKAAATTNINSLSWMDDSNNANDDSDWAMSCGAKSKDERKKTINPSPAAPDPLFGSSAFQGVSLEDGASELEFSSNNLGDSKKADTRTGFRAWGKSWEFSSTGEEKKKQETSEFGGNNPWGFGSKTAMTKKKIDSFDFGQDSGSSATNDLSAGNNDVTGDNPDDAWLFGGVTKEEPETEEEEWSTCDKAKKTKKAVTKKKMKMKKIDDPSASTDLNPNNPPATDPWSTLSRKADKKGKQSFDYLLPETLEPTELEPLKEPLVAWDFRFSSKEKRKKHKAMQRDGTWDNRVTQEMVEAEAACAANLEPEPEPEPEPVVEEPPPIEPAEPRFPWNHGLGRREMKRTEMRMKQNGTWDDRLTQEMIDEGEAAAAAAVVEPGPDLDPEPSKVEPEPESIVEKPAIWTFEPEPEPQKDKSEEGCNCDPCLTPEKRRETYLAEPESEPIVEPGPETELRESRESLSVPDFAEEVVQRNLCASRRQHLQEASRWQECSMCMGEVVSMARSAARA